MQETTMSKYLNQLLSLSLFTDSDSGDLLTKIDNLQGVLRLSGILGVNSYLLSWLNSGLGKKAPLPSEINNTLLQIRYQAIIRNQILLHRYQIVNKALTEAQIANTAIKGLWLLQHNQKKYADRITSDIDILIRPEDLKDATHILQNLGYIRDPVKSHKTACQPTPSGHHLVPLRNNGVAIELHYRAFPGSPSWLNTNLIGKNSRDDHFLVLLYHFMRHLNRGDFKLKWFYELIQVSSGIDQALLTTKVNLIDSQQHTKARNLFRLILQFHVAAEPEIWKNDFTRFIEQEYQSNIQGKTNLREYLPLDKKRIVRCSEILFPNIDYLRFIYPELTKKPIPLIYLVRWIKLCKRLFSLCRCNGIVF